MTIAEIMILTGHSQATIYRWVRERAFPRAVAGEWDRNAVEEWWSSNRDRLGRWPEPI